MFAMYVICKKKWIYSKKKYEKPLLLLEIYFSTEKFPKRADDFTVDKSAYHQHSSLSIVKSSKAFQETLIVV